uniref:Uncharacterized protein n=1 Tax=Physcomitrium patens TaxID=3218 RepID=A0A7I4EQH3_PHYPA
MRGEKGWGKNEGKNEYVHVTEFVCFVFCLFSFKCPGGCMSACLWRSGGLCLLFIPQTTSA